MENQESESRGWMVANVRTGEFWLNTPRGQWTTKDQATVFPSIVSGPLPTQACWVQSDFEFTATELAEFKTRALARRRAGGEEIPSRIGLQYRAASVPVGTETLILHRVIGDLGDGCCLVQNSLKVACHVAAVEIDGVAVYPSHDELAGKQRSGDASLVVDKIHHEEFVWAGLRYFCGWDGTRNPNYNPAVLVSAGAPADSADAARETSAGSKDAARLARGKAGDAAETGETKVAEKYVGWVVYKAEPQPTEN